MLELKKWTVCMSVRDGGETPVGLEANWQTEAYRPNLSPPPTAKRSGYERRGEEWSGADQIGAEKSGMERI